MDAINIYLTGVGGQGIGLLSEIVLRAGDYAGYAVKGVDTHGLAQRGGIVVSQIRMGDAVYTPLIPEGQADIVLALERHEAFRSIDRFLKNGGTLAYYNTVWQPLGVRLGEAEEIKTHMVRDACQRRNIREIRVFEAGLEDIRMQNIVLLAAVNRNEVIPGVEEPHYRQAMEDLMAGGMLEKNLALFQEKSKK